MQNFAPGWTAFPHFGHVAGLSEAPHSLQNFAPAVTAVWQRGHVCVCAAGAWLGCAAGAWPGCNDGASALPMIDPRLMPAPKPTPAPARLFPPAFAASSSASAALKRV